MAHNIGLLLVASAMLFFAISVPRGGKLARFIDTPWETSIVLGAVCALAVGAMLMLFGMPNFLKT
jgi:hypothetical protein